MRWKDVLLGANTRDNSLCDFLDLREKTSYVSSYIIQH